MGTNLVRDMRAITILVIVVAAVCSLTLSVAGQRQRVGARQEQAETQGPSDCTSLTTDGQVLGQCIPVRQCGYFMRILSSKVVSQSDRDLLRDNRCQQQQHDENSVYVCCPLDIVNNKRTSGSAAREAFGVLRHPQLPTDCGTVKWQRSNDTDTHIKEYPWLTLIEYMKPNQEKLHACAGVLISPRYVLTAAHCVSAPSIAKAGWEVRAVRLGEWDTLTNPDCQVDARSGGKAECAPPFQDIPVDEIIVHSQYNTTASSQTNDIAMIRLREPAQLSDYVQPICLPNKQLRADELEDLVTEVSGWRVQATSRPKKSQVVVTSIEKCQAQYATNNIHIVASQLCGVSNSNECHGNSGGPLMLYRNEAYILGGLLSFGPVQCARTGYPDIYTRVASYIDWIHDNLKP